MNAITDPLDNPLDNDAEEPDEELYDEDYDPIADRKAQRRRKGLTVFAFLLTLILGLGVGAFFARQRYRAQKVMVSINGQTINQDDFVHRMEIAVGPQTLQRMANEMLQDEYAHKLGVNVTQKEVDARFEELNRRPEFAAYMANNHLVPDDVKTNIHMELTVNKIVGRDVTVTEADARAYYKQQTDKTNPTARFYTPPKVTIAVITATDDPRGRASGRASAQSRIRQAKAALDKGEDFNTVAAKYSEDLTSKDKGGELPPIVKGRTPYSRIPNLENVIFAMKPGEQQGPLAFKSPNRAGAGAQPGELWAIIRCVKQEPENTLPYEGVAYECRVGAMMAKLPTSAAAKIRGDYTKFQQEAVIHTFRPEYKMVFGGR